MAIRRLFRAILPCGSDENSLFVGISVIERSIKFREIIIHVALPLNPIRYIVKYLLKAVYII